MLEYCVDVSITVVLFDVLFDIFFLLPPNEG